MFKIPRNDFLLLLDKNMDVANRFIKMLANDIIEKEEQLLSFAYNSVKKRVSEALILLREKNASVDKDGSRISIPREDLANLVGTATETVIRTLSEFKEDKLIKIKGRIITILDHKGLEKYKY
jgi:CRP-like cAMP-binding protein